MRRTIIDEDETYTGSGPQETSKSRTSSCYCFAFCIRRDHKYNVAMPMRDLMITVGVYPAIYIWEQLALQAKKLCPNRSFGAILGYPSLN